MPNEKPLSVAEARARILAAAPKIRRQSKRVALADALGRTLAEDLAARRTQPPVAVSAMDGYALRAADVAALPAQLTLIGESAAGHGFAGAVGAGECVRIFTGAPVPPGADTVLMQEYVKADGAIDHAAEKRAAPAISSARPGSIFPQAKPAARKAPRSARSRSRSPPPWIMPTLPVMRRPRVAILATGDELVRPGETIGARSDRRFEHLCDRRPMRDWPGGEPIDLGIAGDDFAALEAGIRARARGARPMFS